MKTERYGLFDLYTKIGDSRRYVGRNFGNIRAYYSIPKDYEIEPFTITGRREIIDRIYDGTFPVITPNPFAVSEFGIYLEKARGYEKRTFNANAF